jgi:hypothetical protein
MGERRSLVAGLEVAPPGVDPDQMRAFISQQKPERRPAKRTTVEIVSAAAEEPAGGGEEGETPPEPMTTAEVEKPEPTAARKPPRPTPSKRARTAPLHSTPLVPVTVRLKPEIADALKRASLERQLNGIPTFTQQDIVEDALVPWLRSEGLLD